MRKVLSFSLLFKGRFVTCSRAYGVTKHEWEAHEMPVYDYGKGEARRRLYAWGLAASGALGIKELFKPTAENIVHRLTYSPRLVPFSVKHHVTHAACGYGFTVLAGRSKQTGTIFGTGLNTCCQLGHHPGGEQGTSRQWLIQPAAIELPFVPTNDDQVVDVSCGRLHTLIATNRGGTAVCHNLKSSVSVFSLGNNSFGQCGRPVIEDEDYENNCVIHHIRGIHGVPKTVVCGLDHSLVLTTSGTVYAFGSGTDGQLGNETLKSDWQPTLVQGDIKGERITQVASSADCVLALSEKGEVFGWGNSEYKQLGMVTDALQVSVPRHLKLNIRRVKQVAVGGSACAVLTTGGEVFVWGFGIIGLGPENLTEVQPTCLPLPLFGASELDPNIRVEKLAAGLMHFAAINSKAQLYMWGKNRFGLLGLGHEDDQFFPFKVTINASVQEVALGPDHTIAICRTPA